MKNLILALIVLFTTTNQIISQEKFNIISYEKLDNGEYRTLGHDKSSGEIYYTSLPDTVIKDPNFYGKECIIIVYDDRKDDVDFFPILYKAENKKSITYNCYNANINVEFVHNITDGTYTALFVSSKSYQNAKMKYYLEK
tara:strand:- start:14 stop:433 length:420 start_codon:yes stop_codon:yes gene_type:complete